VLATLSAILREDPKPLNQFAKVPKEIDQIISRCLSKDVTRRYQSMAEVAQALEKSSTTLAWRPIPQLPAHGKRLGLGLAALAAIIVVSALLWSGAARSRPSEPALSLTPVPLTAYAGFEDDPTFSPDGSQLAFSWFVREPLNQDIYVKLVGPGEPLRLTRDAAEDFAPSWSPDGRWIAFLRGSAEGASEKVRLMVIPALGGPERVISEVHRRGWPSWSPDSRWLATASREQEDEPTSIFLIALHSGEKRRITYPSSSFRGDFGAAFSPDGRQICFIRTRGAPRTELYVLAMGTGWKPRGEPRRVPLEGGGFMPPAWTADGKEIVVSAERGSSRYLWRVNPAPPGSARQVPSTEGAGRPAIARQSGRMVYGRWAYNADLLRFPLRARERNLPPGRIIASTREDLDPSYSPDGERFVFISARSGHSEVWVSDASGSRQVQLTFLNSDAGTPRWAPDGRQIAFDSDETGKTELYVMRPDGSDRRQLTRSRTPSATPGWSPDSQFLYFRSAESGREEIWRISAHGGNPVQVTRNGGLSPLPSPDGKYLYYFKRQDPGTVWRMSLRDGSERVVVRNVRHSALTLSATGLWYPVRNAESRYELQFAAFSDHRPRFAASLVTDPTGFFAVSPDERWALVAQNEREESDLMVIENFH
jgi:Tol biopolymer transport system component